MWSSIVILFPFLLGFDACIGHQLISNAAQHIGRCLCGQYDGLDHCRWNLPNDGTDSSRYTLLVMFDGRQFTNGMHCVANALKIELKKIENLHFRARSSQ